jgi:hypothetical protein
MLGDKLSILALPEGKWTGRTAKCLQDRMQRCHILLGDSDDGTLGQHQFNPGMGAYRRQWKSHEGGLAMSLRDTPSGGGHLG